MDPVCFHIGARPVYWFGVLAAMGFGAALWHWTRLARIERKPAEYASDVVLWIMVGGILGARLTYVVANWEVYAADLVGILRIDRGGLIFYGGFIGGTLAVLLLGMRRRENLLSLGDLVVSGVPLGHAFGRVGCYLNGCCHGDWTRHWIGQLGGGRQPVQLYEAVGDVVIYYFLAKQYARGGRAGSIVALYLVTYPALRFMLEFLRGDERHMMGPLSLAQWISIGLLVSGIVALQRLRMRRT
ncbi:MAG: prolipoprotein diacylglyceryl transferase [Lentisphaerae bacterium]|nr:prolipoprotein diacylglyceryl transferase [Lentisphaerota bacterium]